MVFMAPTDTTLKDYLVTDEELVDACRELDKNEHNLGVVQRTAWINIRSAILFHIAAVRLENKSKAGAGQYLVLHIRVNRNENPRPVKIKLRPDLAPKHVERIIELTEEGFYNGVTFHRVIPGFVAQTGDRSGTGMHGSDKPDLSPEFNSESHVRGICSMARKSNPGSANSQFFICYETAHFLNRNYTVWGQVVEGMDIIDALPKGEPPSEPGVIHSAQIVKE